MDFGEQCQTPYRAPDKRWSANKKHSVLIDLEWIDDRMLGNLNGEKLFDIRPEGTPPAHDRRYYITADEASPNNDSLLVLQGYNRTAPQGHQNPWGFIWHVSTLNPNGVVMRSERFAVKCSQSEPGNWEDLKIRWRLVIRWTGTPEGKKKASPKKAKAAASRRRTVAKKKTKTKAATRPASKKRAGKKAIAKSKSRRR